MNLILTQDRLFYRRWINLLFSFLITGSAQYFSGRKWWGIGCFVSNLLIQFITLAVFLHPHTNASVCESILFQLICLIPFTLILLESLRKPIPRLSTTTLLIIVGLFLLEIGFVFAIRTFAVEPFVMPSRSMAPAVFSKDYLFVEKVSYHFGQPKRGDIIAFKTDEWIKFTARKNEIYIKRIVGLPGETITINPPYIIVNEKKLVEPDIFQKISYVQQGGFSPCHLGDDEYYVLGDNSANSLDSRYYGPIKKSSIIGRAFYIYAPAEHKGLIK